MVIGDIMSTQLITVEPDDTLGHAASLFRQHQVHQLPVVQELYETGNQWSKRMLIIKKRAPKLLWQGLVTPEDIERATALAQQGEQSHTCARLWQEQRVAEIMQCPELCVMTTTPIASAAQLLVEQGMQCLPVVEPEQEEGSEEDVREILVGLVTRSDLLLAFARYLGAGEPGSQLVLALPADHMAPLARALLIADELHVCIQNLLVTPFDPHHPRSVSLRLGTIHPAPFFRRLEQEGVVFAPGDAFAGEAER